MHASHFIFPPVLDISAIFTIVTWLLILKFLTTENHLHLSIKSQFNKNDIDQNKIYKNVFSYSCLQAMPAQVSVNMS